MWGLMNREFEDLSIDNIFVLNGGWSGLERILLMPLKVERLPTERKEIYSVPLWKIKYILKLGVTFLPYRHLFSDRNTLVNDNQYYRWLDVGHKKGFLF